ncbi:uncharacterized protein ACB057_010713 [Neosynchiropus ocellatus]
MPQPGMNGMEPAFGEAYGGHRGLLSPYPLAMSPQGGRTEYDQSVPLMLGSPASPRKRPFELLSDLVDDGGLGEDLHPERWDVSSLDEMARYTRLGVGGELLACSEDAVLMCRWGRSREEQEGSEPSLPQPPVDQDTPASGLCVSTTEVTRTEPSGGGGCGGTARRGMVEVYQVAQDQEDQDEASGDTLVLEHCSEEHNYSLSQGGHPGQEVQVSEAQPVQQEARERPEEEVYVEADPPQLAGERPSKRRCFWEYRRCQESSSKKKVGGDVHWSLSWSSSTLPSTLYRREGKKGRRKARKTDASDLTPNPQKLHSIGEQLQKLNAAIDGMGPVHELPAVARARSRKEKNKLASRACRLKKKAQHEANKIKLWGLNQEYENLLGALLRIKEVIRQRVESGEEDDVDERGMTRRLQDILRQSNGPLVAGRTKDFVQRILAASAGGPTQSRDGSRGGDEAAG